MRPPFQIPPVAQAPPPAGDRQEDAAAAAPSVKDSYHVHERQSLGIWDAQPVVVHQQRTSTCCIFLGSHETHNNGADSQADGHVDNGNRSSEIRAARSASSNAEARHSGSSSCQQDTELCNGDAASINRRAGHPDQHGDGFETDDSSGGQEGQQSGDAACSVSRGAAHLDQQGHAMSEKQGDSLEGAIWDQPAMAGWHADLGTGQAEGGDEVLDLAMASAEQQQQQQQQQQSCPPSGHGSATSTNTSAGW